MKYTNINGDSKLLSRFPWSINRNPDNNLESLCISTHYYYYYNSTALCWALTAFSVSWSYTQSEAGCCTANALDLCWARAWFESRPQHGYPDMFCVIPEFSMPNIGTVPPPLPSKYFPSHYSLIQLLSFNAKYWGADKGIKSTSWEIPNRPGSLTALWVSSLYDILRPNFVAEWVAVLIY
jgi:hypothetical protein